jgi:hypothetical protein
VRDIAIESSVAGKRIDSGGELDGKPVPKQMGCRGSLPSDQAVADYQEPKTAHVA